MRGEVDRGGAAGSRLAMVGEDEKPRGQRHELPAHQERIGVIGEEDESHRREENRIERQHASRFGVVPAIAVGEHADKRGDDVEDEKEGGAQRVKAEMPVQPWQADRQDRFDRRAAAIDQECKGGDSGQGGGRGAQAIDDAESEFLTEEPADSADQLNDNAEKDSVQHEALPRPPNGQRVPGAASPTALRERRRRPFLNPVGMTRMTVRTRNLIACGPTAGKGRSHDVAPKAHRNSGAATYAAPERRRPEVYCWVARARASLLRAS